MLFLSVEGNSFNNSFHTELQLKSITISRLWSTYFPIGMFADFMPVWEIVTSWNHFTINENLIVKKHKEVFYVVKLQLIVFLLELNQFIHILYQFENWRSSWSKKQILTSHLLKWKGLYQMHIVCNHERGIVMGHVKLRGKKERESICWKGTQNLARPVAFIRWTEVSPGAFVEVPP